MDSKKATRLIRNNFIVGGQCAVQLMQMQTLAYAFRWELKRQMQHSITPIGGLTLTLEQEMLRDD